MIRLVFMCSCIVGERHYQFVFHPFEWYRWHIFNTEEPRFSGQSLTLGPFQLSVAKARRYTIDKSEVKRADKDQATTSRGAWE